jgi:N-acetylmuramic acid 6-phosphate etherase
MLNKITEQRSGVSENIDSVSVELAASILFNGQLEAVKAVDAALTSIVHASSLLAQGVASGGNIIYCAAGSSGLMALADGLELSGTYGILNDRVKILLAGGDACLKHLRGGPEDDDNLAIQDVASVNISSNDTMILLSASGSTPYVVKALSLAKDAGLTTIAIANNENAPILNKADVAVFLPTPPEVIAGSTRMGAGTAQKIALNVMSTLMAIELGHVHDGHMVNLLADNEKLKQRALGIVSAISGCDDDVAQSALDRADGHVKLAVLIASGAGSAEDAKIILERNGHKLRSSLSALKMSHGSKLGNA